MKKVDQKTNWYGNVCTTCGEEVNIVEARYKCVFCSRNIPYPDKRYDFDSNTVFIQIHCFLRPLTVMILIKLLGSAWPLSAMILPELL